MAKKSKYQSWPPGRNVRVAYSHRCGVLIQFRRGVLPVIGDLIRVEKLFTFIEAFIASNPIPTRDGACFY